MKDIEDWIYKELVGEDQFLDGSSFEELLPNGSCFLANPRLTGD